MGAIAAVYTNSGDPNQVVEELLLALKHRGANKRTTLLNENSAFGYSSNGDMEGHLFYSAKAAIAVDGSFYRHENPVKFVKADLAKATIRGGVSQVMCEPGGFAILLSRGEKMFAFRDPNGLKPLYFATTKRVTAFASERKALWRIGLKETNRVFTGKLYTIGRQSISETQLVQFKHPKERRMTFDQAKTGLVRTLKKSIKIITKGTGKIAVAFSGGLDSAVAAQLAKTLSQIELISVGLRGSSELSTVEQYAGQLGLPVTQESFDVDAVEDYVRRILWLIEEPNLMKVSVAIPLHWAAMVAAKRGLTVMLCGQGSDELYGGYYKYARILDVKGRRALRAELHRSIIHAAEVNYERDEQATAPFGIELRTPFADSDVIHFSLTIPSEYKVQRGNDVTRKWVLRASAEDLGVPDEIVWRRKKAIQHGTGVEKAVLKLAKSRNLTVEAYLAKVHAEVREMESMP